MYIRELTNEEFNNFVNNFKDKSVYQTVEYMNVMEGQGYETLFVGLTDNTTILASSLILIERRGNFKYAYAPRGFLIDYDNYELLEIFTKEIKKFLGKKDIIAVKLCPMIIKNIYDRNGNIVTSNNNFENTFETLKKLGYYHYGYNNFFESLKPRFEGIIDINKSYLLLFKNIRKEFKTKIRSAEKKGITIIKGNDTELDYLIDEASKKYPRGEKYFKDTYTYFNDKNMVDYYYAKLDTRKYLELSKRDFEKEEANNAKINNDIIINASKNSSKLLSKKIESDNLLDVYKKTLVKATNLLRDYPDGIVIASALVIRNSNEIILFMDGYNTKVKSLNAKHLLMWKLIEKYSKLGFSKFNLGGMTNPTIKDNKYNGLNEFKLNFNANIIEYIGDLELTTNNALYFMYKKSKQFQNMLKK